MPRHPPCALNNLPQILKMLASTVQFSTFGRNPPLAAACPRSAREVRRGRARPGSKDPGPRKRSPVPSGPNSVPGRFNPVNPVPLRQAGCTDDRRSIRSPCQRSTHERTPTGHSPMTGSGTRFLGMQMLLRKEVIQPHLPVRLPCYDFVPITDPTFGSSLLAVGPLTLGVTDFRDVTGGVYKPRERIHRSVADLRLLATPTSWGRVADPNPN